MSLNMLYGSSVRLYDGELNRREQENRNHMLRPETRALIEYNRWRCHYPEYDKSQKWAKVPSKEFSDMLVEELAKTEE